ncbi:MAG: response regulator [bacterium]
MTTTPQIESPPPVADESAVLVLATSYREGELAQDMLRRAEMPCVVCDSAMELIERIRHDAGPAVVMAEALDRDRAAELQDVLASQPKWSDPPLIMVTAHGVPPTHLRDIIDRRNTTLLHRPLKVATFVTTVGAALENRRRQYDVRDLLKELKGRAHQLQRLAMQLTQTEENERQRLAQVLHDDLQQMLAGAKFHVALLPSQARENQLDHAVTRLSDLLEQAIEKSRALSHDLTPPMLQQHGLVAALNWLPERKQQLHGLRVNVEAAPDAEPNDDRIRVFMYRCAQELLFNVVKHAGVSEAHLRLSTNGDELILSVQDEGRGYDPTAPGNEQESSGLGLLSIRERADLLGGRFEVQTAEGAGSTFTLIMPRQQEAPPMRHAETPAPDAEPVEPTPTEQTGAEPRCRRIILADDHRVMRRGLRSLLDAEDDIEIVAEADDGVQAVELAERLRPDLILMDVSMPRLDGIETTRRVKAHQPAVRVIGLSMFDDEETASKLRDAGAENYLSKAGPIEHLLDVIRRPETSAATIAPDPAEGP